MRQALPITIDKSFAQAASAGALAELAAHWVLVVPSAFYWEIFTTDPIKRVRALEGMPEFRRVHLPKLLRKETETGEPVVALDTPRLQVSDDLRGATWSPNAQQSSLLDRYRKQSVEFALDFWKQVILGRGVPGFSSDELLDVHDSNGAFATLCKKLNDRERIRTIALEIGFSHAAKIDRRWLWFRFL
jgi:hypothetical protein